MGIVELIGIIGATMLALCGLPQAVKSFQDKHSDGLSWGFLLMWGIGEILVLFYVLMTSADLILITNYVVNLIIGGVIVYYKLRPDYNLRYMD